MELDVNVSTDHLRSVAKASPLAAILELVWNSLDADATRVQVTVETNELGGVEAITVTDNGTGMSLDNVRSAFGSLGGSWKKLAKVTEKQRRALHGQEGKGRFKVFSLGTSASWRTVHERDGVRRAIAVASVPGAINKYDVSEPSVVNEPTGTVARVTGMEVGLSELLDEDVADQMAEHLAPYLLKYPDVVVTYRGDRVDPKAAIHADHPLPLGETKDQRGVVEVPMLRVIEWKRPAKRELHLCDPDGFSLAVTTPKIHAPGYDFTAYLASRRIRQLHDENTLALWEMSGQLDGLVEEARQRLKQHYRETRARQARTFIDQLKADNIYPYKEEPRSQLETATRQMFDALAVNLPDLVPHFEDGDTKAKSLSLHLLAHAIEMNPKSLQKILTEVLGLSREKQDELAEILEQTTLDHIVSASKVVTDRLKFLDGLTHLVYSQDFKNILRERSHLHHVLEENTWLFGEEYNLTASDKSLNEVLRRHRDLLGDPIIIDEPVVRADGSEGIIDLMMSRTLKLPNPKMHEHLIIEIKRPSVKITDASIKQTRSYARAIANDARFKSTETKWTFIALSSDLDADANDMARQPQKPVGLVFEDPDKRFTVWAKRWSEVIDDSRARLSFFKEKLAIELAEDAGLKHMREAYSRYLPDDAEPPAASVKSSATKPSRKRKQSKG